MFLKGNFVIPGKITLNSRIYNILNKFIATISNINKKQTFFE